MLVLTRKQNEKIQIGENITVTVLRMKGKGVRLGIQAPDDMNVLRGELVFDLEDDLRMEDSNQEQTALEAKAPEARSTKPSRQMRTSTIWSNDTHPNLKEDPAGMPVANSQPCWSI